jgi:hypothetical protein
MASKKKKKAAKKKKTTAKKGAKKKAPKARKTQRCTVCLAIGHNRRYHSRSPVG